MAKTGKTRDMRKLRSASNASKEGKARINAAVRMSIRQMLEDMVSASGNTMTKILEDAIEEAFNSKKYK